MHMERREFLQMAGMVAAVGLAGGRLLTAQGKGEGTMYGLIGRMTATPGQRDTLISILLEGIVGMPGCLSYVVARDTSDDAAIWITEVWDSKESHDASLSLPSVRDAIVRARPLIAGFGESTVTMPVGGHGLESLP